MTVKELRERLKDFDEDMDVKIFCGSINEVAEELFEDVEDGCPVISY